MVQLFLTDVKKLLNFSVMLNLPVMVHPFISSDDGEKVSFFFFECIIS